MGLRAGQDVHHTAGCRARLDSKPAAKLTGRSDQYQYRLYQRRTLLNPKVQLLRSACVAEQLFACNYCAMFRHFVAGQASCWYMIERASAIHLAALMLDARHSFWRPVIPDTWLTDAQRATCMAIAILLDAHTIATPPGKIDRWQDEGRRGFTSLASWSK